MASIRTHIRADGSVAHRVFFRHDSRQTCYTFDSPGMAEAFRAAVDQLGPTTAIALHRLERLPRTGAGKTVGEWVAEHIEGLSGVQRDTATKYRAYLKNDITPVIGLIPLAELTERDVGRWIQSMTGNSKTKGNKQRFLSSALSEAVKFGHMTANVAAGAKLPRSERRPIVALSREQYALLLSEITAPWRPLVEFLVGTGCRWGEVTALRPPDINRAAGTARISRAWKYDSGTGYFLGPPKTNGSERTIEVPASVLAQLTFTGEYLFTNPGNGAGGPSPLRPGAGGPVRVHNFSPNVWRPACARAKLDPRPRIHDLRHTYSSWMVDAGVSLAVVQQGLGHEDIRTTIGTYTHLDRRSAKAAAGVMDKLLSHGDDSPGDNGSQTE